MAYCIILVVAAFIWLAYETRYFTIRLPSYQSHKSRGSPGTPYHDSRVQLPTHGFKRRLPLWILIPSLGLIFVLLSPAIFQFFIFRFSGPHPGFDCDDGALLMLKRFSDFGISSTAWIGNLKITGEDFGESDHVWIMANVLGWKVPFDWGSQRIDKQHFEGYEITYEQLLQLVEQDIVSTNEY